MMPAGEGRACLLWWALFAALMGICVGWMMTTPVSGSPDEGEHVVRAAGVVRGQVFAERATTDKGTGAIQVVPTSLAATRTVQECFAFSNRSAACARSLPESTVPRRVVSGAGRYFPLYYFPVGLPSLGWPNETGVYLMRLVSAGLCAGLFASALLTAFEWRRSRLLLAGVAVAVTPEAFFLAGSVNPNSVEIAGSVCLWAALLVLADHPREDQITRLTVRSSVAAVAVLSTRALAPIWVLVAVAAALAIAGLSPVRELIRRGPLKACGFVVAAFGVMNVAWTAGEGALDVGHSAVFAHSTFGNSVRIVDTLQGRRFSQMIGVFGWLSADAPKLTFVVWILALVALLVLALAYGSVRLKAVLLGLMIAVYLIPTVIEARELPVFGLTWQGRYTLPLAVGVPILATLVLGRRFRLPPPRIVALPAAALVTALGLAQAGGFLWALGRAQTGSAAFPSLIDGRWTPPGGTLVWVVLFAAGLSLLYGLVGVGLVRRRSPASAGAFEDVEDEGSKKELHT